MFFPFFSYLLAGTGVLYTLRTLHSNAASNLNNLRGSETVNLIILEMKYNLLILSVSVIHLHNFFLGILHRNLGKK